MSRNDVVVIAIMCIADAAIGRSRLHLTPEREPYCELAAVENRRPEVVLHNRLQFVRGGRPGATKLIDVKADLEVPDLASLVSAAGIT